jgi:carbon catabolite-derepressing protein kinase
VALWDPVPLAAYGGHVGDIPLASSGGYTEEVEAAIEQWNGETGTRIEMGKKAPAKKDISAADKAAQGLYLVETRARYGDIMVS